MQNKLIHVQKTDRLINMNLERIFENVLRETKYEYPSISESEIETEKDQPIFNCARLTRGEFIVPGNRRDMPFKLAASWAYHYYDLYRTEMAVIKSLGEHDCVRIKFDTGNIKSLPYTRKDLYIPYISGNGGPLHKMSKKYEN